jgi:hypothetical protein
MVLIETERGALTSSPMYEMPLAYDHSITKRPIEKESNLNIFLKSCLEIIMDDTSLNVLHRMTNQCAQDKKEHVAQRVVN